MQKKEESAASHNTGVSDAKGKSCRRETIIHVCYTIQQRPDHFLNKTWQKKKKKKKKCSISGCWSSRNETNPARKAAGKKQFYSESRKVLTRSSLKQRDRLHLYIPAQWTRRKKTRYRRASIRVWGFRFWSLAKNKGWLGCCCCCFLKLQMGVCSCGMCGCCCCCCFLQHPPKTSSVVSFSAVLLLIRFLLQCCPLWVGLCVFVFLS